MRSFVSVNYALRLNKAIERRLMFRALDRLRTAIAWPKYRYYGMGAMWFMDFHLAHRVLGIHTLTSFERDPEDAKRARSNRPLKSIEVLDGDLRDALLSAELERHKALLWLDFDEQATEDTVNLLRELAGILSDGSVLIVSLPARLSGTGVEEREQEVRDCFGTVVPQSLPSSYFNTRRLSKYPTNLARLVWGVAEEASLLRADEVRAERLFSFVYGDGQAMSTVGLLFGSKQSRARVREAMDASLLSYIGEGVTPLSVPLLTAREKGALDRLLPAARGISVKTAEAADVHLSHSDLSEYRNWYADYPVFAEVEMR